MEIHSNQNESEPSSSEVEHDTHTFPAYAAPLSINPIDSTIVADLITVSKIYPAPIIEKPLQTKFHPRSLKEFSKSSSCPVRSVPSNQRDELIIRVWHY